MPMMKNVLGLDLGSHTMKAVELRQTFRGLEPVQLRIHPCPDAETPLSESLHRFVRMHQLSTEHVVCALPGDRLSTRRLQFPFRDRKKLAQAVPFEVEGDIPFHLEDVVVDWQLVGGERSQAVVAATIAQRRDVSHFLQAIADAGCPPRILEAEGLVLGNLATLFDLPGPRLLLDMGHRKSTLCLLIDEHPVFARSIPIGGLAVTRALARDRALELDRAEQIKCEEGLFLAGFESASPGAVDCLDRLAREVRRSLDGFEDVLGGPAYAQLDAITLVGGAARLHRVDEYLAERTGVTTQRLALPSDPEGAALVTSGDPVLFGPAIALALRSTARANTGMNFRQDEFAYRTDFSRLFTRELRPTGILAGVAVALMAISATTSIALESRRADRLEARSAAIYRRLFPDAPVPDRPMAALSQAVSEAQERADFLGLYAGNRSALDLMAELSRRVPSDLEVKFDEINIDRNLIRIRVTAKNYEAMDRLENQLKSQEPFERAEISGKAKKEKDGTVSFGLNIPLQRPGDEQ